MTKQIKRTVPQAVFDSKEAIRIARNGHLLACRDLDRTPRHLLGEGNPNNPKYEQLFGYDCDVFLAKQYR